MAERIVIGSDHAGLDMKKVLIARMQEKGCDVTDVGPFTADSVDYPVYAAQVARAVAKGEFPRGIVVCGTGIGVSIVANRFTGVRCSLCTSVEMAEMTRKHNDSNCLSIGGRITTEATALAILDAWLDTAYEGGRHDKRVQMLDDEAIITC